MNFENRKYIMYDRINSDLSKYILLKNKTLSFGIKI